MKKLFLFLTLLSLVFSSAASAVEYVTLNKAKTSIITDPTDLIECVGIDGQMNKAIPYGIVNGVEIKLYTDPKNNYEWYNYVGSKHTGVSKLRLWVDPDDLRNVNAWVTYKITKASEINKVGPTSVLVLPEDATGNYDLIVESSSDSVTWTPFHSQAVQSDTVKRLFRVRIVHKGQEEAKAKAEEK